MAEPSQKRVERAAELMTAFAERTGLSGEHSERRYLWTDAFAVCNFLGLAERTHDERYRELSLALVDRVHHVLGQHRPDDARSGWLSGLSADEGEQHPTRGGLRIGKKLPERRMDEPFDRELEWDRDGQYFHYLTQWMHALNQAACFTHEPGLNLWARELAATALAHFRIGPLAHPHLAWKLSIDLSRPLVPSMGQHDALDGFATLAELRSTAFELLPDPSEPRLNTELADLVPLLDPATWATDDPLGLGGILLDAHRIAELVKRGALGSDRLVCALLVVALEGLEYYAKLGDSTRPASRRLAFRELGLAIGLSAVELMDAEVQRAPHNGSAELRALLEALRPHAALGAAIESFWLDPQHTASSLWSEHRDINEVMLATRLIPQGYLGAHPSG